MTSKFEIGDVVTWASQANGSRTQKTGKIFYVVKPGERMNETKARTALVGQFSDVVVWVTDFEGLPRKEQSYLVVVPGTGRRLPRGYWPRTSALRLADPSSST